MELRQLKYFVVVAEEGNFGAAARRLNISQPPITRQIKKLEDELGVVLLKRTPKGAQMTAAGQVFLEGARQALTQIKTSVERSRAAQRGEIGTLEVAYFGSPIYAVLPDLLQAFRRAMPEVRVSLQRLSKSEQIAALKVGQIHMGFGRYYPAEPGIVVEQLLSEGLSVALPESYTDVPPVGQRLELFKAMPVVLFPRSGRPNFADEVLSILKREGVDPQVADVTEDVRSALTLTAIGEGATIVPGTVTKFAWSGVRFYPLEQLSMECPVSFIYRKGDTSPLLRAIYSTVRAYQQAHNTRAQSM
ncbi:MAG: LysR family transcriptional regulator [Pseudomonadota bacterium]